MREFVIDTPRSRKGSGAPFTVQARDVEEALDKVAVHMAGVWFRTDYTVRD